MVGALYNGLSGIKTQQFGIDVTANNISNINTTGFRENNPGFQSLFATSLNGVNASSPIFNDYNYGVKVGSNAINAKDGAYINADGDFNVAYSGRGWFVVGKNKEGSFDLKTPTTGYRQNYFTRDGTFSLDGEGYLVNSAGYYMYGINLQKIAADGSLKASNNLQEDYQKLAGSSLSPIRIPQNLTYSPVLTTEVQLAINVNRTQNGKPISVLSDAKGKFDLDKFLNQDINTFMDSSSTPIDARNFKDIVISLKKGSVLTDYTFTYGKEGDNSFTTVAELVKLVKDQTGLDLSLELNDEDHPADCTLMLSNNTIQNMQISIKGKLADKLNLKTTKQSLESSIDGVLKDFKENEDYKEGDYVKYKGLVFMKNNNDPAEKNPLEDEESWTLVDSTRVLEYNNDKKYKEGDVVVLDGKIYQRSNPDNDSIDEDNPPVDIQDSEIGSPLQTPSFWKEIGDLAFGEFKEYQAGSTYQANSFVLSDGKLYQKINGEGNTNPLEDKEGWRRVSTKAINTTSLQVPTYQTNTEIYDDAGKKFILKNEYVLLEQGNYGVNPAVEERWEVRSSIYDHTGKIQISEDAVINELTFNAAGEATIPVFQVPFNGSSLAVDLSKSVDGKTSSNFAFGDSSVKSSWQNGTSEGALKSTSIDANGIIFVNFTNGKVEPIGRFGVAAFVNDQGLHKVGGNLFEMDFRFRDGQSVIASGAPIMAWEEDRSAALKYGRVLSNKLESSNVDTGAALTDLIIYQRGYQASAKSITTADQLLQEAIQLKRN